MLTELLRRCCAVLLAIMVPVAFAGADGGSFVANGAGRVTINGKVMEGRQAVFSGDEVVTAPNASAALSMPGANVKLDESTDIVYEQGVVRVNSGTARIVSREMSASFENVIVRPVSKDGAQYMVGKISGRNAVAALHGSVLVSDGTHMVVVHEGNALTRFDGQQGREEPAPAMSGKSDADKKDNKKKRGAGADARSESTGMSLPGWAEVAIIGGTVGGVLGGLALAGYFSHPISPTAP